MRGHRRERDFLVAVEAFHVSNERNKFRMGGGQPRDVRMQPAAQILVEESLESLVLQERRPEAFKGNQDPRQRCLHRHLRLRLRFRAGATVTERITPGLDVVQLRQRRRREVIQHVDAAPDDDAPLAIDQARIDEDPAQLGFPPFAAADRRPADALGVRIDIVGPFDPDAESAVGVESVADGEGGEVLDEDELVGGESGRKREQKGELEAAGRGEPLVCAAAAAGELECREGEERSGESA